MVIHQDELGEPLNFTCGGHKGHPRDHSGSKCLTSVRLPQGRLVIPVSAERNTEADGVRGHRKGKETDFEPTL